MYGFNVLCFRLHTIVDSDRVAVFSSGKLVELDSPQKLLSDHSTAFAKLAKDANLI